MSAFVVPQRQRPRPHGRGARSELLTAEVIAELGSLEAVQELAEMTKHLRFGLSSAGLVRWAVLAGEDVYPAAWRWPSDWDDLERCELAYALAPAWLQQRMAANLVRFRAFVVGRCQYAPLPDQFRADL